MDILFLLKPNFKDQARDSQGKLYYCPDCAFLEGVLSYYPQLRNQLDIRYVDYPHPRAQIVELVGDLHRGCPCLITQANSQTSEATEGFYSHGEYLYTNNTRLLVEYLSKQYDLPIAHY